jgi:hypothetical protein
MWKNNPKSAKPDQEAIKEYLSDLQRMSDNDPTLAERYPFDEEFDNAHTLTSVQLLQRYRNINLHAYEREVSFLFGEPQKLGRPRRRLWQFVTMAKAMPDDYINSSPELSSMFRMLFTLPASVRVALVRVILRDIGEQLRKEDEQAAKARQTPLEAQALALMEEYLKEHGGKE